MFFPVKCKWWMTEELYYLQGCKIKILDLEYNL